MTTSHDLPTAQELTPMEQIRALVQDDGQLRSVVHTALRQIGECFSFIGDEPTNLRTGEKMDLETEIKDIYKEVGQAVSQSTLATDTQAEIGRIIQMRLADTTPLPALRYDITLNQANQLSS